MAVGYVLINVKPGSEMDVYEIVKELDMVEDATLLFGDYDLLAKMCSESMGEIAAAVVEKLSRSQEMSKDGVNDTKTLAGAEL